MISCLTDFITLRNTCNPVAPSSGIYFNDHPAVSIARLDQLTGEDYTTFSEVYDRIYNRSLIKFEADVMLGMSEFFSGRGIVENVLTGKYTDNLDVTASSTDRRGVFIEVNKYSNLSLKINHIHLYLGAAGSVTITIHDANTGTLLDTLTFTGVLGHNTFQINKLYSTEGRNKRFFISYQNEASRKTTIGFNWSDCYTCHGFGYDNMTVRGASVPNGSSVTYSNLDFSGNGWGMIASINLICSVSEYICQRRTDFLMCFWDKLVLEFLEEVRHSDRINDLTLKLDAEAIDDLIYGSVTGGKPGLMKSYTERMADILKNANPENDGICFQCDEAVEKRAMIP